MVKTRFINDLVFPFKMGSEIVNSRITRKEAKAILEKANLPSEEINKRLFIDNEQGLIRWEGKSIYYDREEVEQAGKTYTPPPPVEKKKLEPPVQETKSPEPTIEEQKKSPIQKKKTKKRGKPKQTPVELGDSIGPLFFLGESIDYLVNNKNVHERIASYVLREERIGKRKFNYPDYRESGEFYKNWLDTIAKLLRSDSICEKIEIEIRASNELLVPKTPYNINIERGNGQTIRPYLAEEILTEANIFTEHERSELIAAITHKNAQDNPESETSLIFMNQITYSIEQAKINIQEKQKDL